MGGIGQETLLECQDWSRVSTVVGQIGQEYLSQWVRLVKSVHGCGGISQECLLEWQDRSRVSELVGEIRQEHPWEWWD